MKILNENKIEDFETNEQYMERMGLGEYYRRKQRTHSWKESKKNTVPMNTLKCHVCDLIFEMKPQLYLHMQVEHGHYIVEKKVVSCCFCSKIFFKKPEYHEHLQAVHGQTLCGNRRFILCACPLCGKIFNNMGNLSRHLENKHNSSEAGLTCDFCQKQFKSKLYLKKHIRIMHLKPKPKKANISTAFAARKGAGKDMKVHCPVCQKEFNTEKQLAGHKNVCSLYVEITSHVVNEQKHLKATEKFVVKAKIHEKPKSSRTKRGRPLSNVGEPPYICDICGKQFNLKGHIYNHINRNHLKLPVKKQTCKLCNVSVFDMKAHLVVHSIERPFSCDICNASFKKSSHLKTHRFLHTGEKPHVCPMCSKAFVQLGDMYKHARRAHNYLVPRKKKFPQDDEAYIKTAMSEETLIMSCEIEEIVHVKKEIEDNHHLTKEINVPLKPDETESADAESFILEVDDFVEQTAVIVETDKENEYEVSFLQ